jgi:hypothetical protein
MSTELWTALQDYALKMGDETLSAAVRRLVREKLTELGHLKRDIEND